MGAWNSKDTFLNSTINAIGRAMEDVMFRNKNLKTFTLTFEMFYILTMVIILDTVIRVICNC